MWRIGTRHTTSESGYVSEYARFKAVRCEGCPLRCLCFKAKGKRTIELNHRLRTYKQKAMKLLCSKEGLKLYGKLVGDKGYIGKHLFERLSVDGIQLIIKLKINMKGALMPISDKLLLRKRVIIETINDELKNILHVEHSRHRIFDNFIVNLLGAIAAYCCFLKKPCINVSRTIDTQLTLF